MGPTILFIHLKIILLQYFQFLVFSSSKINSIQTDPYINKDDKRNQIGSNHECLITRHFACLEEVMPTLMKVKGVRGRVTMRVLGEKDKLVLESVQKY